MEVVGLVRVSPAGRLCRVRTETEEADVVGDPGLGLEGTELALQWERGEKKLGVEKSEEERNQKLDQWNKRAGLDRQGL